MTIFNRGFIGEFYMNNLIALVLVFTVVGLMLVSCSSSQNASKDNVKKL